MASLLVRNIDEKLKTALRVQAARHGVSMEEEARRALAKAIEPVNDAATPETALDMINRIKAAHGGGVELDLPDRSEWTDRPLDLP